MVDDRHSHAFVFVPETEIGVDPLKITPKRILRDEIFDNVHIAIDRFHEIVEEYKQQGYTIERAPGASPDAEHPYFGAMGRSAAVLLWDDHRSHCVVITTAYSHEIGAENCEHKHAAP